MQNRSLERLVILGTTHVDKSSIECVRKTIEKNRPSVVAAELDEERLQALRDPERSRLGSPFTAGLLPWLLALLERSVGSMTDVFPGTEMLAAVEEAQRIHARVAMIDKPIIMLLGDLRRVQFTEKARIGIDILAALVAIAARWRAVRSARVDLEQLMAEFDQKYPTLSRILVKERDEYMADRLGEILDSTTGRVVAVVGLGHVRGIEEYLDRQKRAQSPDLPQVRYEWTMEP